MTLDQVGRMVLARCALGMLISLMAIAARRLSSGGDDASTPVCAGDAETQARATSPPTVQSASAARLGSEPRSVARDPYLRRDVIDRRQRLKLVKQRVH